MTILSTTTVEYIAAWATVGTAAGTGMLALATFFLARRTTAEVTAATSQARASLEQVEISQQQAKVAERALAAQTQPLLTDVPWGVAQLVAGYAMKPGSDSRSVLSSVFGPKEAHYRDASEVRVWLDQETRGVRFAIPVRNVGNGTALIQAVVFRFSNDASLTGFPASPVVPPREVTVLSLDLEGGDDPDVSVATQAVEQGTSFSVVTAYADSSGEAKRAVRLDVYPGEDSDSDWWVRQVHWDESIEAVVSNPDMSSTPVR